MAEQSAFSPTWRYNPIKHELQFWHSPVAAICFEEPLLKVLNANGWNFDHKGLLKLPISTR